MVMTSETDIKVDSNRQTSSIKMKISTLLLPALTVGTYVNDKDLSTNFSLQEKGLLEKILTITSR